MTAGRPTKLTPELTQIIVRLLKRGATNKVACQIAGISRQTLLNWIDEAEKDDAPLFLKEFLDAIEAAKGYRVLNWIEDVSDSRWLLTHHPDCKDDFQEQKAVRSEGSLTVAGAGAKEYVAAINEYRKQLKEEDKN